jgi:hypothetical protein
MSIPRRFPQNYLGDEFVMIHSALMWQIGLLVFVRHALLPAVTDVRHGVEATGLMGITPNKVHFW